MRTADILTPTLTSALTAADVLTLTMTGILKTADVLTLTIARILKTAGGVTTAGTLISYALPQERSVSTGIGTLGISFDNPIGNIPKAALMQVCIPKNISSGRMAVLCSLLTHATDRQELCALIDASDYFDAGCAGASGVDLSRLLWVRCGKKRKTGPTDRVKKPELRGGEQRRLKPLEQAFKAADILIQNGGLGLIVIDLGGVEERLVRKIPLTTWFRFVRVIEKQPTALVVFATYPVAQSCAALTLHIRNSEVHWSTEASSEMQAKEDDPRHGDTWTHGNAPAHANQQIHSSPCIADSQEPCDAQRQDGAQPRQADHPAISHAQFLAGLTCEVEPGRVRGQGRKPVQSSGAGFVAVPVWK